MGVFSDIWNALPSTETVMSTLRTASRIVEDITPVGILRDGVRVARAGISGRSMSEELSSIGRERAIRMQGAVDGVGGSLAGMVDLVAGNDGNNGAAAWLHNRTRNLIINRADMTAEERAEFDNASNVGNIATYAIPVGGGWRVAAGVVTLFVGAGVRNGINGVDTDYNPEEPPLPGSPQQNSNQTLQQRFAPEATNFDPQAPITQEQIRVMAQQFNAELEAEMPNLTEAERANFRGSASDLIQPLQNRQLLAYTYDSDVMRFQLAAKAAGLYEGEVDGLAGPLTRDAMQRLSPPQQTLQNAGPVVQPL